MSYSLSFIKDSLKQIISEVVRQGEVIDSVAVEVAAIKEVIKASPEAEKKLNMIERMAKVRAAKQVKKEANEGQEV
jgi:hypothetical protein